MTTLTNKEIDNNKKNILQQVLKEYMNNNEFNFISENIDNMDFNSYKDYLLEHFSENLKTSNVINLLTSIIQQEGENIAQNNAPEASKIKTKLDIINSIENKYCKHYSYNNLSLDTKVELFKELTKLEESNSLKGTNYMQENKEKIAKKIFERASNTSILGTMGSFITTGARNIFSGLDNNAYIPYNAIDSISLSDVPGSRNPTSLIVEIRDEIAESNTPKDNSQWVKVTPEEANEIELNRMFSEQTPDRVRMKLDIINSIENKYCKHYSYNNLSLDTKVELFKELTKLEESNSLKGTNYMQENKEEIAQKIFERASNTSILGTMGSFITTGVRMLSGLGNNAYIPYSAIDSISLSDVPGSRNPTSLIVEIRDEIASKTQATEPIETRKQASKKTLRTSRSLRKNLENSANPHISSSQARGKPDRSKDIELS